MKILIDMQGAQSTSKSRGIGRYSLSLALSMAKNSLNHEIWLLLNGNFQKSIIEIRSLFKEYVPKERILVFKSLKNISYRDNYEYYDSDSYKVAELIREHFISQIKPDFLVITSLFEGYVDNAVTSISKYTKNYKTAVILYDLIPYIRKEYYLNDELFKKYYLEKVDELKKADLFLSISNSSKQEAIKYLSIDENKIENISTAVDNSFEKRALSNQEIAQLKKKFNITKNILLYVPGGFDERKNFSNFFEAYSLLSNDIKKQYQLVIVGKIHDDYKEMLLTLIKKNRLKKSEVIITGYVEDDDLISLYNIATLSVYPSIHEGFGLPVLEAISCGCSIVGSKATSIPEIIDYEEALFDPYNAQDICNKITYFLDNSENLEKLKSHLSKQCEKFSWDKTAINALKFIEDNKCNSLEQIDKFKYKDMVKEIPSLLNLYTDQDIIEIADAIDFNLIKNERQLLVDISVIVHGDSKSGIQRVVRSILKELLENSFEDTIVRAIYFDDTTSVYRYAQKFTETFLNENDIDIKDEAVSFYKDDIYLALDLNAHLTRAVHEQHLSLKALGIKMCYIVYDILLVQNPQWWPKGTSDIFREWLYSITQVADQLICISQAVADEVYEWMYQNQKNAIEYPELKSFHLGADIDNSVPSSGMPDNSKEVLKLIEQKISFLMVGTMEPRKGHSLMLDVFEKLWQENYDINLVIVGKKGWLIEKLIQRLDNHEELNKRLFILDSISDEYLAKIYENSSCLIAASEGEGFGLPLIEAAQHKISLIVRDIPVFKEVAKEYSYYFEDTNDENIVAKAIKNWLDLYKENKHPKSDRMPWLSWKESANNLIKIIMKG